MEIGLTADDYGGSPGANAAIESLAEAGLLTAVSVMAHRDAHLDTLPRLLATGVAVGLHLTFSGARPFVGALGGRRGRLPESHVRLFADVARSPWIVRLLQKEAEAQAERLASAGAAVAFVNGHEHVHLFPALWPIAAHLCRRLGVRAVRCALGQPVDLSAPGALAAASRVSWALSPLPGVAVLSPLGVGRAGGITPHVAAALLDRPFLDAPGRLRELCFHPATDLPGRREEHALLASGAIDRLLSTRGLRRARALPH